ncbi:kinase [Thraustotheca clavata]|uniref:Kinase n=1 Tax=Thraustotheca clavata TaxID=74557 RepID=A0A1W0A0X7_9STRA|nr:kinase [Thraustotheca clavata]
MSAESLFQQLQNENVEIDFNDLAPRHKWEVIGQGGYGIVYKTSLLNTVVAVKVSLANIINSGNSTLIVQEITMLKQVRHPKIVEFLGISIDPNNICIVTEYLGRGSLLNVLHYSTKKLTWFNYLLQYAIDICEGMAYMHGQMPPLLHRDLKSANILISGDGKTAKIADLGFARIYAEVMSARGTERWCAPEILSGNANYSENVDVYSFGILLWEMCTRAIPYQNQNGAELKKKIVNDNLRPEFPDTMPEVLRDIYELCVSAMPPDRPSFLQLLTRLRGNVAEIVRSDDPYPVLHPEFCICNGYQGSLSNLCNQ